MHDNPPINPKPSSAPAPQEQEKWHIVNERTDCFDYEWASIADTNGNIILDTSKSAAETSSLAHNASIDRLSAPAKKVKGKWRLTLLEGQLVIGREGRSPIWFNRHGDEFREQLEEIVKCLNSLDKQSLGEPGAAITNTVPGQMALKCDLCPKRATRRSDTLLYCDEHAPKQSDPLQNDLLQLANEMIGDIVSALRWLDEFVEVPETFPSEGDYQWWCERRDHIRAIANKLQDARAGTEAVGQGTPAPPTEFFATDAASEEQEPPKKCLCLDIGAPFEGCPKHGKLPLQEPPQKGNDRNLCTPEHPMPKGATGRWEHSNTHEVGQQESGWPSGDIIMVRCRNCGLQWREELPQ